MDRPGGLLERDFTADAPDRRWGADITYVDTAAGWVYAAFVQNLFSRAIVGWQGAGHLGAELALDALEMATWSRGGIDDGLVHHSDRGVQYTAIRYAERLDRIGAARSVGSKGYSYDNAAAASLNSLYKKELIDFRAIPKWFRRGKPADARRVVVDRYQRRNQRPDSSPARRPG